MERSARPHARRWREVTRFVIFGATNTLIAYLLYLALLLFLRYPIAYTASYVCGIFVSYYLNATFVFKEPLRLSRALQYPVVYALQYFISMAALYVLVELLRVSEVIAPFAIALGMIPIAYLLSRYVITRR
ncbi:MAG: GtrA family protein [Chthoniobacterales bacterium]|nr:GtrA family protein [Chthoniobacterales bacterium]